MLIFPSGEVLDFAGPFEVFSVTRLDEDKRREEATPFETVLVAEEPGVVIATGGLRVVPNHSLDNCPPLDILLVPGGWGVRQVLVADGRLLRVLLVGDSACWSPSWSWLRATASTGPGPPTRCLPAARRPGSPRRWGFRCRNT